MASILTGHVTHWLCLGCSEYDTHTTACSSSSQYPATSCSHWKGVDQHSTGHNQQPDQLYVKEMWGKWWSHQILTGFFNLSNKAKLHISEWPSIVASLRHTCAIIMLSNQHLDMPNLWGIINRKSISWESNSCWEMSLKTISGKLQVYRLADVENLHRISGNFYLEVALNETWWVEWMDCNYTVSSAVKGLSSWKLIQPFTHTYWWQCAVMKGTGLSVGTCGQEEPETDRPTQRRVDDLLFLLSHRQSN